MDLSKFTYQSAFFKTAAIACLISNYGRLQLDKEIKANIQKRQPGVPEHEEADNWVGYQPNAWTGLYGFRQGYWYYFGMAIFYWHLSQRKGKLSRLELAGLINQFLFHTSSVSEFRGLSRQVTIMYLGLIGAGSAALAYGV